MTIDLNQIHASFVALLATMHISEQTFWIFVAGVIIGAVFFGGGFHRQAYGHYRRWRGY